MRSGAKSLLDFNLPMKKSIILLEKQTTHTFLKEEFYQPYSEKEHKKIQTSPLLPICLTKILKRHLSLILTKLSKYRIPRVNLRLLSEKKKKNLLNAFITIKEHYLQKKEQKIVQGKELTKRSKFICGSLNRYTKKQLQLAFGQMKRKNERKINMDNFIFMLHETLYRYDFQHNTAHFFNTIKLSSASYPKKKIQISNIFPIIAKAESAILSKSFQKLVLNVQMNTNETLKKEKQEFTEKVQAKASTRYKQIQEQKEKFRNVKFAFDAQSSSKSKSKYDLRKELSNLNIKATEEIKKNQKILAKLKKQIELNKAQHEILLRSSAKRAEKLKKVEKMKEKTIQAYLELINAKQPKTGYIQLPKTIALDIKKITGFDEYIMMKNQLLRTQINYYEGQGELRDETDGNIRQNKVLKTMISATLEKEYEENIDND